MDEERVVQIFIFIFCNFLTNLGVKYIKRANCGHVYTKQIWTFMAFVFIYSIDINYI